MRARRPPNWSRTRPGAASRTRRQQGNDEPSALSPHESGRRHHGSRSNGKKRHLSQKHGIGIRSAAPQLARTAKRLKMTGTPCAAISTLDNPYSVCGGGRSGDSIGASPCGDRGRLAKPTATRRGQSLGCHERHQAGDRAVRACHSPLRRWRRPERRRSLAPGVRPPRSSPERTHPTRCSGRIRRHLDGSHAGR